MEDFIPMGAAEYRALGADALVQRQTQVIDLLNAEALPEGVTDEMLYAERDLIVAEINRRNAATALRESNLRAVAQGAGTVVASTEPEAQERGFQAVSEGNYTDSAEYRTALAQHISRQAPMPAEMLQRARMELRATGDPVSVSVADAYSNYTDPLGVATFGGVPLPLTFINEVARCIKEYGGLENKVNRTTYQGGVAVSEAELVGEAKWISDKQTAPYNPDSFATFTFSAWQLEYRIARSLLAQAIMTENFTNSAEAIAAEFSSKLNAAIWAGTGSGQPIGITTDTRLLGEGTQGQSGYVAPKATIVEVSADDIDDWAFWMSVLYKLNSAFRGRGEWIMGDGLWGEHISVLRDENNRPIANLMGGYNTLNDVFTPALAGRPVNLLDASIAESFEDATAGDVIAAFGNPRNYTLNTQPGMPLTTISWDDHDNNLHKTKVSMACDGRVTNPYGWLLLTKKASG